jgi:hypothetical protein
MARACTRAFLSHQPSLDQFGLSTAIIEKSINYVYEILDGIDAKLLDAGGERLSELVELANLSAIIGNLYRGGVVRASQGRFSANAPHTYPDLLGSAPGCKDIEIKVALEKNSPKGHLIKPGPHLTLRYVLADESGNYQRGKENRGNVAWIWEVRVGYLTDGHFNVSNTDGDSGKTAVINAAGLNALKVVYCDMDRCPLPPSGAAYREAAATVGTARSRR